MFRRLEDESVKIEAAEPEPEAECRCSCLDEKTPQDDDAPPVDRAATGLAVYYDING